MNRSVNVSLNRRKFRFQDATLKRSSNLFSCIFNWRLRSWCENSAMPIDIPRNLAIASTQVSFKFTIKAEMPAIFQTRFIQMRQIAFKVLRSLALKNERKTNVKHQTRFPLACNLLKNSYFLHFKIATRRSAPWYMKMVRQQARKKLVQVYPSLRSRTFKAVSLKKLLKGNEKWCYSSRWYKRMFTDEILRQILSHIKHNAYVI